MAANPEERRCAAAPTLDAQFLAVESARTYGHVGGLAIYDPSTAPGGRLEIGDLCRLVGERLHQLPPFHQRLVWVPFGLDHPYWIEDPNFDLGFHIRDTAVPPPGDDRRLAETVARIFARPLDRRRPLWELYLIHGIEGGKVGILSKVHHAAVDGVSGAEIMGVLYDLDPDTRAREPGKGTPWTPERRPGQASRCSGAVLVGLAKQPLRAARSLPAAATSLPDCPAPAWCPACPPCSARGPRSSSSSAAARRTRSWSTCAPRGRPRRASTGRSARTGASRSARCRWTTSRL